MRVKAMLRELAVKAYQKCHRLIIIILVSLIGVYRYLISPCLGSCCRFHPSCSVYSQQAILELGVLKGLAYSVWRVLRCHPWHPGGYEPVVNKKWRIKKV